VVEEVDLVVAIEVATEVETEAATTLATQAWAEMIWEATWVEDRCNPAFMSIPTGEKSPVFYF
jgi:hypothetical protein